MSGQRTLLVQFNDAPVRRHFMFAIDPAGIFPDQSVFRVTGRPGLSGHENRFTTACIATPPPLFGRCRTTSNLPRFRAASAANPCGPGAAAPAGAGSVLARPGGLYAAVGTTAFLGFSPLLEQAHQDHGHAAEEIPVE